MVKTNLQKSLESLTDERLQQEYEGAKNTGLESTYEAEIARRKGITPEVMTPETISMTPRLNELIEELGEENIPDDVLDIIDPLRNPTEKYGLWGIRTKFGELDPEKQGKKLRDKWMDMYNTYGMEPDDPNIRKIMSYLTKMRMAAESGKQISHLSPDQQGGIWGQWWKQNAPRKASDFNLVSSAMAGELSPAQAGNQALNQTPNEVATQIAASQGQGNFLGYTPDPGNVQAPTMTQQQMVEEAIQTGGTVNPHEATQAVYAPSRPSRPVRGPHGKARGGVISLQDLLNRRV